ncbi:MAG: ABC transporter permease [Chloroflexota bacterium]
MRMVIWLAGRRLLAAWPVEAALGVGVLVIVTLISLVSLRSSAMAEAGLQYALATRSSQLEQAVQLVVQDRPLGYQDYQDLSMAVGKAFENNLDWLPVKVSPAGQSQSLPFVLRVEETPPATGAPRAYPYFREEFESHARLVDGRWPDSSIPPSTTLEAVIGEPAALGLRWAVGQRLFLVPLVGAQEEKVEVRIVGVVQPRDIEDPYWLGNLSPFYPGSGDAIEVPLVTGEEVFFDGFGQRYPMLLGNYWWHAFLDLDSLTAANTPRLKESLASLESEINLRFPRSLALTGLDIFIESYQRSLALSRLPLYLFASLVVSVVLYYLVLMALMAAPERGAEAVMLRSRGATACQVAYLIALGEGLALAVPAVLAGPLLAWALNTLLPVGYSCSSCSIGLSPLLFLTAGLVSVICIIVFVAAGLGVARQGVAQFLRERGRPGEAPALYRYGIDVVAMVTLGLVWWQIRGRGGFVADRLQGAGIQADLSLVLAPALMLVVAGLLGLRLYPWLLRLLAPLTRAFGTAWAAHALRRMARAPLIHASLAVLVMQTVALGVFGAMFGTTLARSIADQASYSVGGDVVAVLPERYGTPVEELSRRTKALPGVEALSVVYRGRLTSPRGGLETYGLLAAQPAELALASWFRSDLAGKDVNELLAPLERKTVVAQGVALPKDTEAVGIWVRPSSSHPGSNLYLRLRDATGEYANVLVGNLGVYSWTYLEAPLPKQPVLNAPLTVVGVMISGVPSSGYGSGSVALDDITAVVLGTRQSVGGFESPGPWTPIPYQGDSQLTLTFPSEAAHSGAAGALYSWTKPISDAPHGIFVPPVSVPIPAVGSSNFGIGQTIVGGLAGQAIALSVQEVVPYFPTLYPDEEPFLVVNWEQLQRYRDAMLLPKPLEANELWIKVREGSARDQVVSELKEVLPPHTILKDSQELVAQAVGDPLSGESWPRLAAIGQVSLVVIMLVGFGLYAVIGLRRSMVELAVLRAMGLSRYQIGWMLAVDAGLVGAMGLGFGIGIGTWVGRWVLGYLGLTSQGRPVTPPMELAFSQGLLLLTVVGAMVATSAAVLLAYRMAARLPVHEVLRMEE